MKSIPTLHEEIINPTNPANPRNGEGSVVALRDGRLLMAWTKFTGPHDHSQGEIYGRYSLDDGFTWGEPFLLQKNIGQCNVMSVSFLRLSNGDLLLGHGIKNHESLDCHMFVKRSHDDGKTWSEHVNATPEEGYIGANNDRPGADAQRTPAPAHVQVHRRALPLAGRRLRLRRQRADLAQAVPISRYTRPRRHERARHRRVRRWQPADVDAHRKATYLHQPLARRRRNVDRAGAHRVGCAHRARVGKAPARQQ